MLLGAVPSLISGLGSLFGGGSHTDARPARAQQLTGFALQGDLAAARIVYKQQNASHTEAGRQAYQQGWQQISAQVPPVAAAAVAAGGLDDDGHGMAIAPPSGLKQQLNQLVANLKQDVGDAVHNIGVGGSTQLANQINPQGQYAGIPLALGGSQSMLLVVALLAVVLVLVLRK